DRGKFHVMLLQELANRQKVGGFSCVHAAQHDRLFFREVKIETGSAQSLGVSVYPDGGGRCPTRRSGCAEDTEYPLLRSRYGARGEAGEFAADGAYHFQQGGRDLYFVHLFLRFQPLVRPLALESAKQVDALWTESAK